MPQVSEFSDVQEIRLSICDAADFREAAELVQAAALQIPGVDAVGIYAFDDKGDFHLVSHSGVSPAFVALFNQFPAGSLQALTVMEGEAFYRIVAELPPDRAALYVAEGLRALAVYPIKHRQHVVGSLHVGTRKLPEIPRELYAQLEVLVQGLANTIARITYEAMVHKAYQEVEAKVTERTLELQKAMQSMRESEERYRALFDRSLDCVFVCDLEGRFLDANDSALNLTGYSRNEISSLNLASLLSEDQLALALGALDELKQTGSHQVTTYTIRCKDGSFMDVESQSSLIFRNGVPYAVQGVARDVTERQRHQQALRDNEAKFRMLAKSSQVMIAIARYGRFVYINPRLATLSGYTEQQLLSMDVLKLFHPEFREVVQSRMRRLLLGKPLSSSFEYPMLTRTGDTRWVEVTPVRIEYQGAPAVAGVATDITARKLAEETVRTSEARFRQLADAMPQLVWTAKPDGTIDYCNQRAEQYAGIRHTPSEIYNVHEAVHPDDLPAFTEAWRRALEIGGPYQFEHRLLLRSGVYRWHLSRATPHRDESGQIVKWYATSTDIDDQRRVQEVLQAAQRRKDDFIAMLGHELRNPLAPIRNVVHLLKRPGPVDPLLQRCHEIIDRQVSHMARLIDDLLDVSRITRGKIELKKERVDLTEILRHCAEDFQPLFAGADVRLDVKIPDSSIGIFGDTARLEQIVSNLMNNAMKFTEAGGTVSLSLNVVGAQAEITVKDTGLGIEPGALRSIFEPFSQVDATKGHSRGGLGLGLSLVKGLTTLHGGSVQAESEGIGRGALFRVRLPILEFVPAEKSIGCDPLVAPATTPKRKIMIIEDNLDAAESLRMLLSVSGHEIVVAHSGSDGVAKANAFKPQIILCDIGLPGSMDGYGVARSIRADPQLFATQLFAMTGFGQEEDRRKARDAGFDNHLTKPVDPEVLERLLAQ